MTTKQEWSDYEGFVEGALDDCAGIVKQCAKSAISHLRRAERLLGIDNEMACFRAITAQEEAASALINSLQARGYFNAARLHPKDHLHKLGIAPVIDACSGHLCEILSDTLFESYSVGPAQAQKRRALEIALKLKGIDLWVKPTPPLHSTIADKSTGKFDIAKSLQQHLDESGPREVVTKLRDIANQRNRLLYAGHDGWILIKDAEARGFFESQRKIVFRLLSVLLLSDPWVLVHGKSGLVQQVLDAYLVLLEKIKPEEVTDVETIVNFNRKRKPPAPAPDAAASAGAQSSESPDH